MKAKTTRERRAAPATNPADDDPVALEFLRRKVAEVGRKKDTLTYKELFDGALVVSPAGSPARAVDVQSRDPWHRAVISAMLRRISEESLRDFGFMASALVVRSRAQGPATGFYTLAKELDVMPPEFDETEQRAFWKLQRHAAHRRYAES